MELQCQNNQRALQVYYNLINKNGGGGGGGKGCIHFLDIAFAKMHYQISNFYRAITKKNSYDFFINFFSR